ncbi:protein max-like isoform X2 [Watersipora subatra]|uniref:protein max-like isoform X2 n=1 Tax=Watersipora subatra TaxID=2589382 RepID=UPI00355B1D3A
MEDDTQSSREDDDEDIANLFDVVISDPSPANRRAHHNALERRRRDLIKASFHSLQVGVPNITDNKASRAQILKKATSYITMMKDKISKIQYEINMMKEGQKTLEQQASRAEGGLTCYR